MMENLSDSLLIEAYYRAMELQLNDDFIKIIEEEIDHRQIEILI